MAVDMSGGERIEAPIQKELRFLELSDVVVHGHWRLNA